MYKTCIFITFIKCLLLINCELLFVKTVIMNKDNEIMSYKNMHIKNTKINVHRMTWLHSLITE
jgi:hypothetical protein